jgi:hypothetical protein
MLIQFKQGRVDELREPSRLCVSRNGPMGRHFAFEHVQYDPRAVESLVRA